MHPIILVLIFIVATVVGYLLIKTFPASAHAADVRHERSVRHYGAWRAGGYGGRSIPGEQALGFLAIVLAMLNVAGGFGVTHRMLRMFRHKREKEDIRNE